MSRRPVTDMLGRVLEVPVPPRRILSLCPSQTETLFELGLGEQVVGITRYCIHPRDQVGSAARVGGTKKVDLPLVETLRPDLIVAEKEENPREMVEALSAIAPVYVTDVVDVPSALEMIARMGDLCGASDRSIQLVREIRREWDSISRPSKVLRAAYLIWREPWMAAGPNTYIDSLLATAGFENIFAAGCAPEGVAPARYPEFTLSELALRRPEVVLLSSEPYPFREKHLEEVRSAVPKARVLLTDGEPWSWYGARMRRFPALVRVLHEELARV